MRQSESAIPHIIQGGMGIAVSGWRLAREVASAGALGVISGTGIELVVARRLQDGDPDGEIRTALAHFPAPAIAQRVLDRYYLADARPAGTPYRPVPMLTLHSRADLLELIVCANFVEVWLAKAGHTGQVGINLLEKVQLSHLPALYGAMLAGVDVVLMGAGIPVQIPGVLDDLARHEATSYRLEVEGASDADIRVTFDPQRILPHPTTPLRRPAFLAIISSATLAKMLITKASGTVEGFVVEGPTAGGHNAPPRGKMQLSESGEPIYGPRDIVDLPALRALGRPFWLAGSYAHGARLQAALDLGAAGIQAGTIFALSDASGFTPAIRQQLRAAALQGTLSIFTDPLASPTSYPFKVAVLDNTLALPAHYAERPRHCDIGRLRQVYQRPDGAIGYRCPAEPIADYVKKGGEVAATAGRKCLCNALMANIGLPQRQRNGYEEAPLVTLGDDVSFIHDLIADAASGYSAADAIAYLRGASPRRTDCPSLVGASIAEE